MCGIEYKATGNFLLLFHVPRRHALVSVLTLSAPQLGGSHLWNIFQYKHIENLFEMHKPKNRYRFHKGGDFGYG